MANPPNAVLMPQPMDPADTIDYSVVLTQGPIGTELLEAGEGVASFTLALTAEAAAAGLQIKSGAGYGPNLVGLTLQFWLSVDPANQADAGFSGAGLALGIELTITSNAEPARVKQRTIVVQVAQQ